MIAFCALRKWAFLQLQAEAKKRYLRQGRLKGRLLCLEFRLQLINEIQAPLWRSNYRAGPHSMTSSSSDWAEGAGADVATAENKRQIVDEGFLLAMPLALAPLQSLKNHLCPLQNRMRQAGQFGHLHPIGPISQRLSSPHVRTPHLPDTPAR